MIGYRDLSKIDELHDKKIKEETTNQAVKLASDSAKRKWLQQEETAKVILTIKQEIEELERRVTTQAESKDITDIELRTMLVKINTLNQVLYVLNN